MNVFIVMCNVDYEGSYPVAVFADETDAQLEANRLNANEDTWYLDHSIIEMELEPSVADNIIAKF